MALHVVAQMDDGYLEQFPMGAINHIGLPESTLPKEVTSQPTGKGSQHSYHSVVKYKATDRKCMISVPYR